MAKPFDYSKWDNIELSDDESDCHPNIDRESWFRMKHRSRVEREEQEAMEKESLTKANKTDENKLQDLRTRLQAATSSSGDNDDEDAEDPVAIKAEIAELGKTIATRNARLEEMEKSKKWNWENMCHVVEERTIVSDVKDTINTSELPPQLAAAISGNTKPKEAAGSVVGPEVSGSHAVKTYGSFVGKHEQTLEEYSELESMDDTEQFLRNKGNVLFADNAQSYLLLACLEDEMNGKRERMKLVARQSQILTHITELAISLKRPPQDVVTPFFRRLKEKEHGTAFWEAVDQFAKRVQKRAVEKRKEMMEDEAETQRRTMSAEERVGPGGLDPVEVFETLPPAVQEAFETRDTQKLVAALSALPSAERKDIMKRCEDSGLWVPSKEEKKAREKEAEDAEVDVD